MIGIYKANELSSTLFNGEFTDTSKKPDKKKKSSKKRTRSEATSSSSSSSSTSVSNPVVSALDAAFANPQPYIAPPKPKAVPKVKQDYNKKENKQNDDRTLFFGNVPIETTTKQLKRMLVEMLGDGCVESIRFRSVAVAGTKVSETGNYKLWRKASANKGKYNPDRATKNAYVVFKTIDITDNAVDLNGHLFKDNHLRVDRIGKKNHKKEDQKRSVFLGNLPFNVEEEQIHTFFAKGVSGGEESIVNVRVIRDKGTNMGIGIGYVEFADDSYTSEAVALNGGVLAGRPVRVQRCHKSGGLNQKNRKATIGRSAKRQKHGNDFGKDKKERERKPRSDTGRNGKSFQGAKADVDVVPKIKKLKKSKTKNSGRKEKGKKSKICNQF